LTGGSDALRPGTTEISEIGLPCELPNGVCAQRAVPSHQGTDIGGSARLDPSEYSLDLGPGVCDPRRSGRQGPAHHHSRLISSGRNEAVSRSGQAGDIGAREIILRDHRPSPAVHRRHPHCAIDVDGTSRRYALQRGVATNPAAGIPWWRHHVTAWRLIVAATTTRVAGPVGWIIPWVVTAIAVPVPGVVITVRAPSDITGPPHPAHPGRTPISPPRPHPSKADVEVPRAVVVGQPSPGLVRDPRITGGCPVPPPGAVGLPIPAHRRLPGPGVDRINVDPAPIVVELGSLP
jgi:hypothetical protein